MRTHTRQDPATRLSHYDGTQSSSAAPAADRSSGRSRLSLSPLTVSGLEFVVFEHSGASTVAPFFLAQKPIAPTELRSEVLHHPDDILPSHLFQQHIFPSGDWMAQMKRTFLSPSSRTVRRTFPRPPPPLPRRYRMDSPRSPRRSSRRLSCQRC